MSELKINYRVEKHARDITHLVQENENMHLSEKSIWDITSNVREACRELQSEIDKIREENPWRIINEYKLWLVRTKPQGYEEHVAVIEILESGLYIRNMQ